MSRFRRSLTLRLSALFALVTAVLLGGLGLYLYHSLQSEIAWRDDQMLRGRLARMTVLLDDSDSIDALRQRPRLYANMLDNRESVLWILDASGQVLIEVNPHHQPVPALAPAADISLATSPGDPGARLAWTDVERSGRTLTLIAGKRLGERQRMLAVYRFNLWLSLIGGSIAAFVLGAVVTRRGLRPLRRLTSHASVVDTRHLDQRLPARAEISELQALSDALNAMLARLEAGFVQLSRFSEDLAHEMRTPLTNLMGQTQQLLYHPSDLATHQELMISNLEEFERLSRMIDSMLFLARAEQPDSGLARESVDLNALLAQLCDYFEGMAEERGMTLVNRAQGRVDADPALLRRALANLLANALRYGREKTAIEVTSQRLDDTCRIDVFNHGDTIPEEHLPLLFERFYRVDASRHTAGDSGGLGLAIVRSIARLHGGDAWVDNVGLIPAERDRPHTSNADELSSNADEPLPEMARASAAPHTGVRFTITLPSVVPGLSQEGRS